MISNGIKFSEKGSKVILYSEMMGQFVRIHVQDFGIGIPDSFKDKVFGIFSNIVQGVNGFFNVIGSTLNNIKSGKK